MLAEIDRKIQGQQIVASERTETSGASNVIDLMDALRASLQGRTAKAKTEATAAPTKASVVVAEPTDKERKPIRRATKVTAVEVVPTPALASVRARAKK